MTTCLSLWTLIHSIPFFCSVNIADSETENDPLPINDAHCDKSSTLINNATSASASSFKRLIKSNPADDNKKKVNKNV